MLSLLELLWILNDHETHLLFCPTCHTGHSSENEIHYRSATQVWVSVRVGQLVKTRKSIISHFFFKIEETSPSISVWLKLFWQPWTQGYTSKCRATSLTGNMGNYVTRATALRMTPETVQHRNSSQGQKEAVSTNQRWRYLHPVQSAEKETLSLSCSTTSRHPAPASALRSYSASLGP